MTIATGDLVDSGMNLVTEGDGLFGGVSFPRIKAGGKPDRDSQCDHPGDGEVASFHTSDNSMNQEYDNSDFTKYRDHWYPESGALIPR